LASYYPIHILPAGSPNVYALTNAANYVSGIIVPLSMVTVFGSNMGPSELSPLRLDAAGRLSSELGGTRLLIDGKPAPLVYASAEQDAGDIATAAFPAQFATLVRIGGRPAEVLYGGTAPGLLIGVCQVNARIPANAESGAQSVQFSMGPWSSHALAEVIVQ
jgi:hypothetical protein